MQRSPLPLVDETAVTPATHATSVSSRTASASFLVVAPVVSRLFNFTCPENEPTAVPSAGVHPHLSTNPLLTAAFKPHSTQHYLAV